jgi:indole-3-glycerol phosphate synthase
MRFSEAILAQGFSVVADIKPRSPEHGDLLRGRNPVDIALQLEALGCPCLTNVTESAHFGGSLAVLREICRAVKIPVLRKDFIETPDDLKKTLEAGAAGVLICCAALSPRENELLYDRALALGLEPLVEVHTAEEMAFAASLGTKLIGINNRDIARLELDGGSVEKTSELIALAPKDSAIISESGILTPEDAKRAKALGAHAVLVGSALLLADNLETTYREMCAGDGGCHRPAL